MTNNFNKFYNNPSIRISKLNITFKCNLKLRPFYPYPHLTDYLYLDIFTPL